MDKLNPVEALELLIGYCISMNLHPRRPGQAVFKAPMNIRKALETLSSDDIRDVRVDKII